MECKVEKKKSKIEELNISFYDSITVVEREEWEVVNVNQNTYLSWDYLNALEESLSDQVQFTYVLFRDQQSKVVAIAYFQLTKFIDSKACYEEKLCRIPGIIKSKILKKIELNVLTCGNLFACGEHGFMHAPEISTNIAHANLVRAIEQYKKAEKNKKFSIVLMKEFWPSSFENSDSFLEHNFLEFKIDVNMVLDIHPSWDNLDAYLQSMTTKFRTRANGVYKKSKGLEKKHFTLADIVEHEERIDELYGFVLDKADFKFGVINAQAFIGLKKALDDKFCLTAYFLEDELIGFMTSITSGATKDANFVGLDYRYNNKYALYQRMLYDIVALSIEENIVQLRLGRTAEEIKSCLGAKPVEMKLYTKHKNTVSNQIIKQMIKSVGPSEFELRKPFKVQFYN